jgi:hypothetical protein
MRVNRRRLAAGMLACSLAALLILVGLAAAGAWHPRIGPLAFLAVLSVELALLGRAIAGEGQAARGARIAMVLVPLVVSFVLRGYRALSASDVLEWDETYYLSLAVTAADGRGLYPYIFGYGPMPILGGVGYAAYSYALAVMLAGPTIVALRAVSLLASLAGLCGIGLITRLWYGTAAAWIAVAITSALRLFAMSNTARPDSMAFAWVAGALLVWALARGRPGWKGHLTAGLVFGLGLQVHLDTAVTAVACGVVYLLEWVRAMRAARGAVFPTAMLQFTAGWSVGLALFVACNILPDPEAFYKTTVLIRVDATSWYSGGTSSVVGSFLDPRILLSKEEERYALLLKALPSLETGLILAGILGLVARRGPHDRVLLTLNAAVLVVAAAMLNNASPLYFIHVSVALILPIAPLFTRGLRDAAAPRFGSTLAFVLVVSALVAVTPVRDAARIRAADRDETANAAFAGRVRAVAGRDCRIAGNADLYVRFFADYPYFISTRPTEVSYAMLYHGDRDEAEYWKRKAPDVVFAAGPPSDGLAAYVTARGMSRADDGIWIAPGGCRPARPAGQSR